MQVAHLLLAMTSATSEHAGATAVGQGFAAPGDVIVVIAGLPFGRSGGTNLLHVLRISG